MKHSRLFVSEDLLLEVLSFLPVKSLLRFKCVCKLWYDLIVNPIFVSKQISHSDNNVGGDRRRLIVGYHRQPSETGRTRHNALDVIVKDFRFDFSCSQFLVHSKERAFDDYQRLLGSYNGLVCLTDLRLGEFVLWNPATRQSKLIRQSGKISSARERTEHAFGYDFKRNDYRIMRFSTLTKDPVSKHETEVYIFNTDTWSYSDAVIPDGICFDNCYERPRVCVQGVYSTMAYTRVADTNVRNSFLFTIDMSNDEFILTPMPQAKNFRARDWRNKDLVELHESVAFIKDEGESYAVFILNDYGPNGEWAVLYTIPTIVCCEYPIGSWRNDIVFDSGCQKKLIRLDSRTQERESLGFYGGFKQVLEYNESLAWADEVCGRRFRKED